VSDDITLRIEPARKSDTPVILRMIQALVDYERLTHEFSVTESILEKALFGARPAAEVVLGYVEAEPVGFAVYFPTFTTASGQTGLYLEDLYVEPQWRGRRIGRKLFAHVARVAATRGGGSLTWSVLNWNEAAIRFYRSLGAEQIQDSSTFRLVGRAFEHLVGEDR
jgi:ribosomal protein S18 acetylase RimI-like enzyme